MTTIEKMTMIRYFSFNSHHYDFWEIYDVIKTYYPIGIEKGIGKGIYFEYPGIKALEKIIVANIHNQDKWKTNWVKFTNEIGLELEKPMIGTTYGQAPSYSSSVILEQNKLKHLVHNKELHFAVSLIGRFYQIYGLDITLIREINRKKGFTARNVITTSPYKEFKESFEFVEEKIKNKFPDYRIIPFSIGQLVIKGLQVRYLDDTDCSVNQALFNKALSGRSIPIANRGDSYYGIEYWKK